MLATGTTNKVAALNGAQEMYMNWILLSFAFLTPTDVAATVSYRRPIPATYCMSVEKIDQWAKSCKDNGGFLEAGQDCIKDFKKLKTKVTADLKAKLAGTGVSQSTNFQGNTSDNSEAVAAHDYLVKIGEMAVRELDEYFDFLEHPADAETDEDVVAESCFSKPADALSDLVDDLEDEVNAMKIAKTIEAGHAATSSGNTTSLDSLNVAPVKAAPGAKGSVGTPTGKNLRPSDISGTEKKKKK